MAIDGYMAKKNMLDMDSKSEAKAEKVKPKKKAKKPLSRKFPMRGHK